MTNYWEEELFPQFLGTIDSCTILELTNYQIQSELNRLAIRAISDFKFPQIGLEYLYDDSENIETGEDKGYYFVNDITQREYNVILARMKQYWVEYQISQERIFRNSYYDRDINSYSPGNMIDKLIKAYNTFKSAADTAEYNYGRVNTSKAPAIGDINE